MFEAEAKAKISKAKAEAKAFRPRPKFWSRDRFGLEALTFLHRFNLVRKWVKTVLVLAWSWDCCSTP